MVLATVLEIVRVEAAQAQARVLQDLESVVFVSEPFTEFQTLYNVLL